MKGTITADNAVNGMWIHQHQDWPDFTWDIEKLASRLAGIRHHQGRLLGRMEGLGFELRQEASLGTLTSDVVKSSAIEGENLEPEDVRSSIARHLGIDTAGPGAANRDVEGVVEMMLDASRQFAEPLTEQKLFDWHAALFPTGRSGLRRITVGAWRGAESGSMQVVSGPLGRERIHFQAPDAERLPREMARFMEWFESRDDTDPVLRAGMAHIWFVTVHPFEDGNGRIARAITDKALARAEGTPQRFYSLSSQIESECGDYYNQLEKQQRGTPEITCWLGWFLDCLGRAIDAAEETLSSVVFKARLWERINRRPVNERQRLVIGRMLEDDFKGYMNTSKYAKLARCSTDTALRDIQDLKSRAIFIQNPGGGRSTSYRLPDTVQQ